MCWMAALTARLIKAPSARARRLAPQVKEISVAALRERMSEDILLLDLASSPVFRKGHIPGAAFVIRARLHADVVKPPRSRPLILTSPDDALARFAARDIERDWGVLCLRFSLVEPKRGLMRTVRLKRALHARFRRPTMFIADHMKAPITRAQQCKLISIGNLDSLRNSNATAHTAFFVI